MGGNQPILHPATSVKAVSVVPSGGDKMDVRRDNTDVHRENTDVRWVGFHPLQNQATLVRRSTTVMSLPFQLVLPGFGTHLNADLIESSPFSNTSRHVS